MRVLLIATNQYDRCMSRMQAQPLPIGLAYLAGALAASPHVVNTLDLMFSEDPSATWSRLSGHSSRPWWAFPFVTSVTAATLIPNGSCPSPRPSLLRCASLPAPPLCAAGL